MNDAPSNFEVRSLAARTAAGFGWLVIWRMFSRVMGLGSTLILVRVLAPTDFGIVALALSVTQAVELLSLVGVEDAVIRHAAPPADLYDTAFTLNVLRGASNALMLGLMAWPMAKFFNEPRLVSIILAVALSLMIGGFENIGVVEFRRELAYDRELKLRVAPRLIGIVTTIAIALLYRTYWALIIGTLVNRMAGVVMTYTFHPHRPRLTLTSWRELMGFSIWVWVASLVGMARDRIEVFVIGRSIGSAAVGTFSIAVEIAILPMSELTQPLAHVMFSSFSRATRDDVASRQLFLRFLGLSATATIPAGVGIALLADPLTHAVLGPNWLGAIPLIQLVAVFNALATFGFLSRSVLEARGMMSTIVKVNVAVTVIRLAVGVVLVQGMGAFGGGVGAMIGGCVDQVMLFHYTARVLSLEWCCIGGQLWRPSVASLMMTGAVMWVGLCQTAGSEGTGALIVQLLLGAALGATVYGATLFATWLAVGSPGGAEADILQAISRSIDRLRASAGRGVSNPIK